jgi:hypothetical protein
MLRRQRLGERRRRGISVAHDGESWGQVELTDLSPQRGRHTHLGDQSSGHT